MATPQAEPTLRHIRTMLATDDWVTGTLKRVRDQPGSFTNSVIASRSVALKPGKIEKIELGKEDLAAAPAPLPPAVPPTP